MEDNTLNNVEKKGFFTMRRVEPMFLRGERDWSVDVLRCLSCFMVCAIHATNMAMLRQYTVPGDNIYLYHQVYRMIFASPTVLFVMVSGIFFLSPERNVRISKVWGKNVCKMVFAYIFWCLIYALYRIYMMDPQPEYTWDLLLQEWMVQPSHMWYIPMIVGLYIVCPIFRPIAASGDTKLYVYIVAVFIGGLILWTIYSWPPEVEEMTTKKELLELTPMLRICQYTMWMLFGWIAYTYRPRGGFRFLIYLIGIAAILSGIYFNIQNWYLHQDLAMTAVTQKFAIFQFLKNTALFYFVLTVFRHHRFSRFTKVILRKWSDSTLIIYLVHLLLLYIMYDNNLFYCWFDMTPWVGVWVYAFVSYFAGGIIGLLFHLVWDPIKRAFTGKSKEIDKKIDKETENAIDTENEKDRS